MVDNIIPQNMIGKARVVTGLLLVRGREIVKERVIIVIKGIENNSCFFVMVLINHNDMPMLPTTSDSWREKNKVRHAASIIQADIGSIKD